MACHDYPLQRLEVPHLGGITVGYRAVPTTPDPSKPTLIMVHSFSTSSELYKDTYDSPLFKGKVNLIGIDLLGHGDTRTKIRHYTYWDSSFMVLQVMDKLSIKKAFILGTSQGGFVCVRCALLAPERIAGILPMGTSIDYESPEAHAMGGWNPAVMLAPMVEATESSKPVPDWQVPQPFLDLTPGVMGSSNPGVPEWPDIIKRNFKGDEGRLRFRSNLFMVIGRDGVRERAVDIRCPVLWMHGTNDSIFPVAHAEDQIKWFVNSPDARVEVIKDGYHYLSYSNPKEVNQLAFDFVSKYA